MNFLRNFHFKKTFFVYLVVCWHYLYQIGGRFCQVQLVNIKDKNYGQFPGVFIKLYKKFWAISTIKWLRKKICRKTKRIQFDGDSVSTLPSIQKKFFFNWNFSGNPFLNPSFRECFGKTMPRSFWICYLKSLCIFPNELKLQPKIPQISRKCFEAKFRGCFCQVQQVNVKEKNYGQFPEVLIKLYKKFWAISTIKWKRKKICRKTKKLQFDRVILRPGWNLPYGLATNGATP